MKYEDVKPQTVYYTWKQERYSVVPIVAICRDADDNESFIAIDCSDAIMSYLVNVKRETFIVPANKLFLTANEAALDYIKYVEEESKKYVQNIKDVFFKEYNEQIGEPAVLKNNSDFNLDSETPSEEKKKPVIHRRRQYKYLIVDGARITFRNIANIFDTFKIDKYGYGSVSNGLTFENHKNDIVQYEASSVHDILKDNGHTVKSYAAYNFDGKLVQIKFDGE